MGFITYRRHLLPISATGTITASQLAADAVTADKIAALAITTAKLAASAVSADKLAANAVTAAKINVTDLFAQNITATGTITGVNIKGATGEFTKSFSVSVPVTIGNTAEKFFITANSTDVRMGVVPQVDDGGAEYARIEFEPGYAYLYSSRNTTIYGDSSVIITANKGAIVLDASSGVDAPNIYPKVNNSYNLGSSVLKWLQCHAIAFYEDGIALNNK